LRQSSPGITKAESLRQAQLMLLRGSAKAYADNSRGVIPEEISKPGSSPRLSSDPTALYAHPYYWGAFFLMGNWL
jgi:CHAT domain-containing protein